MLNISLFYMFYSMFNFLNFWFEPWILLSSQFPKYQGLHTQRLAEVAAEVILRSEITTMTSVDQREVLGWRQQWQGRGSTWSHHSISTQHLSIPSVYWVYCSEVKYRVRDIAVREEGLDDSTEIVVFHLGHCRKKHHRHIREGTSW